MTGNSKKELLIKILQICEKYFSFLVCIIIAFMLFNGLASSDQQDTFVFISSSLILIFIMLRLAYFGYIYVHNKAEKLESRKALELGLLVISFLYLLIAMTGGIFSTMMPVVYLSIAVLSTLNKRLISLSIIAYTLLLEILTPIIAGQLISHFSDIAGHVVFIVLFASLNGVIHNFGSSIERSKARLQLKRILGNIESEAKAFRLADSTRPGLTGVDQERKHNLSAYFEIHDALQDILNSLMLSLDTFTTAVLWFDDAKKSLKIVEALSSSFVLNDEEFSSERGVLSGVVNSKKSLLTTLGQYSKNKVGYYKNNENVFAMLGVPIVDHNRLIGILVADRKSEIEFDKNDQQLVEVAAKQIKRAVVNENLLRSLDKSQNEYYHLAAASKALSKSLSREDVLRISLETTQKIAPFDFGAVVMAREIEQDYEVVSNWPPETNMLGQTFQDKHNLVDWVIRKNQSLVYHDFSKLPRRPIIFTKDEKLNNVSSLLIVPLNVQAKTCGAFVVASAHENFFTEELQHIFQIIANQIAVSLENAQIYSRLETMAITDSLTNLHNKRYFQERLLEIVSRAERYNQKLSLLIMDIDHFKRVNDTYGHPVGDIVLKEVSKVLKDSMRRIDLVARWGGEEFVILLDSSAADNAYQKAEQLRDMIADLNFDVETSSFSINVSFGIAIFPDDTHILEEFFEKADKALYHSKKSGRNKTTLYQDII